MFFSEFLLFIIIDLIRVIQNFTYIHNFRVWVIDYVSPCVYMVAIIALLLMTEDVNGVGFDRLEGQSQSDVACVHKHDFNG